jgi:hypothetical protein
MPPEKRESFESIFRSYADLWLGLWRWSAIMGGASLEGIASLWGIQPPRDAPLAALSQTMDRYMRSPEFLSMMQSSLKLMSGPSCFGHRAAVQRKKCSQ